MQGVGGIFLVLDFSERCSDSLKNDEPTFVGGGGSGGTGIGLGIHGRAKGSGQR